MKWVTIIFIAVSMVFINACEQKEKLVDSVEEAVDLIEAYEGDVSNFRLGLKHALTLKNEPFPLAASRTIITAAVINKGWTFNGSEKVPGGKIHFYKIQE